jgi:hypothetical protein
MGDQIFTGDKVGIGTTEGLSTLTVRPNAPFTLTGTLSSTEGSATVTGTGTLFLSELAPGDSIDLPDTMDPFKAVVAIASDTSLTVGSVYNYEQSGQTVTATPSSARIDDSTGAPQVVVNGQGNVGIGTMQPNAMLDVSGTGAGYWRGCDVSLRVHAPQYMDAWQIVMSTDAGGPDAGLAMWMNDNGTSAGLVFTLVDADDNELDALTLDGTGLTMAGGLAITPNEISAAYTIQLTDYYIYANADAGGFTITLPGVGSCPGKMFHIIKTSGAGDITIAPQSGEAINGVDADKTITTPYSGVTVVALSGGWILHALPAL